MIKRLDVLIVEDNTDQGRPLEIFLRESGYTVAKTETVEGAMSYLQSAPCAVYLDLRLCGEPGEQLIEPFQQQGSRVIVVTGMAPSDRLEDVKKLPNVKVLSKPMSIDEFLELLPCQTNP